MNQRNDLSSNLIFQTNIYDIMMLMRMSKKGPNPLKINKNCDMRYV